MFLTASTWMMSNKLGAGVHCAGVGVVYRGLGSELLQAAVRELKGEGEEGEAAAQRRDAPAAAGSAASGEGGGAGAQGPAGEGKTVKAPGEESRGGDAAPVASKKRAVERCEEFDCSLCLKLLFSPVTTPCGANAPPSAKSQMPLPPTLEGSPPPLARTECSPLECPSLKGCYPHARLLTFGHSVRGVACYDRRHKHPWRTQEPAACFRPCGLRSPTCAPVLLA